MFEYAVLAPGVYAVEHDTALAGLDEIFGRCDRAFDHEVFSFFGTDFLAEFFLAFPGNIDASFFHGLVNDATKVNFGIIFTREVLDGGAFATPSQPDERQDFYIGLFSHASSVANRDGYACRFISAGYNMLMREQQPDFSADAETFFDGLMTERLAQALMDDIAGLNKIRQLSGVLDVDSAAAKYLESRTQNLKDGVHNQLHDIWQEGFVDMPTVAGMMWLLGTDDFSTKPGQRLEQSQQAARSYVKLEQRYHMMVPLRERSVVFEQLASRSSKDSDDKGSRIDTALWLIKKAGTKMVPATRRDGQSSQRQKSAEPSKDLAHSILLMEAARLLPLMFRRD